VQMSVLIGAFGDPSRAVGRAILGINGASEDIPYVTFTPDPDEQVTRHSQIGLQYSRSQPVHCLRLDGHFSKR
jgi:hypothetical protein